MPPMPAKHAFLRLAKTCGERSVDSLSLCYKRGISVQETRRLDFWHFRDDNEWPHVAPGKRNVSVYFRDWFHMMVCVLYPW